MGDPSVLGQIGWADLTVPDAAPVRDFYQQVTGWSTSPVDMGGYQDYCMIPSGSEQPVSGICHARGGNAGLPPVWLIYITVADLDESIRRCQELGGKLILPPKAMGNARYCVIQDTVGASVGLYEAAKA
jgi:predicted enzyme related to lactoylglutathione lyase